jgi:hypothetical protein
MTHIIGYRNEFFESEVQVRAKLVQRYYNIG